MTAGSGSGRTWAELGAIGLERIKGIGGRRIEALSTLGIESVADLLMHYPRDYADRSRQLRLSEMELGEKATVVVDVDSVTTRRVGRGRLVVKVNCSDGSERLGVTFFNQAWRERQLAGAAQIRLFGKLESFGSRLQMTNPVVDLLGDYTGRLVPVYPSSEKAGITSWDLARWIAEAIRRSGELADPLESGLRDQLGLMGRTEALAGIHQPADGAHAAAARKRLAFDELLRLQCALVGQKVSREVGSEGFSHRPQAGRVGLGDAVRKALPFELTRAQNQALAEIGADLARPVPMHRLLQGDVGSGKTAVALLAMATVIEAGHQAAIMAPTEVLAEQHYLGIKTMVGSAGVPDPARLGGERSVRVELLTSKVGAKARRDLLAKLDRGEVDIVVGTHALLQGDVAFSSLGLAVVDEQHRFGVEQRAALHSKRPPGQRADPDLLVMTATPIPRTAAMTVFGDLDLTVMDELPAGRTPVRTRWLKTPSEACLAWEKVREQVGAGRRAYVVCPLVEGSERVVAASAMQEHDRLASGELAGLRLGLLHGQMSASDKQGAMDAFRSGRIDVLVATTVIEVGVDVADATVMVVQDAHMFGIAQLHQLRGRVGRSGLESWCFLLSQSDSVDAAARLEVVESSNDGFVLARKDLELRGEGTLMGTRQRGRSDLRLASVLKDEVLVDRAREVALCLVGADPTLSCHPILAAEMEYFLSEEVEFLHKS